MSRPPIELQTLLFTDLEGSTRLWEAHREAMVEALADHDRMVAEVVAAHGGRVVKSTGDGCLAAFGDADAAVAAAVELQFALQARAYPTVGSLRARMAVHRGEVHLREGDVFGPSVNRCARVLAVAHATQILVSGTVAQALAGGVRLRDLGVHALRDLLEPEHLFQVMHPDLPADFPPLRGLEAYRHNLPGELSRFVGRESELAEVEALLREGRLVTLTGPGGTGKTRLSLRLGAEVLERFAGGVWLVELAALTAGALVSAAVAEALSVREQTARDVLASLINHLQGHPTLLLLDNCEHLLAAVAPLAQQLLAACPELKLLATSREPLHVPGELICRVPTLPVPPQDHPVRAADLARYPATHLFCTRAAAAVTGFAPDDEQAAAVAAICRRLDGLPLAIELAAARVTVLSPQQLADKLSDRFRLLTGGSRTAMPRHRTLRAAVEWSHELLDSNEQALFAALAVFAGSFDLAGAERVADRLGLDEFAALDLLGSLVDKSFVVREGGAETRYRLLETLRAFGRERLAEPLAQTLQQDLLVAGRALAEQSETGLRGAEQAAWLTRLEREHDNLRAALEWSLTEPAAGEDACALAAALWLFWYMRGHLTEGRRWLGEVLAHTTCSKPEVRAKALNGAGILAGAHGDVHTARAYHGEALAVRRELGDREGEAGSLNNLGLLAVAGGDLTAAGEAFAASLALYRALDHSAGIATALSNLGGILLDSGELDRAEPLLREGLALYTAMNDRARVATVEHNLGEVAGRRGDGGLALEHFRASLRARSDLGDRRGRRLSLLALAQLAASNGDWPRAALLAGGADSAANVAVPLGERHSGQLADLIARAEQALGAEPGRRRLDCGRQLDEDQLTTFALGEEEPPTL